MLELATLEVRGSPRELGRAHGEALRDQVRAFVAARGAALRRWLTEHDVEASARDLTGLARACQEVLRVWHPAGLDEHRGVAEGAGVDADDLYLAAGFTDVRDILADSTTPADQEGCSAVVIPAHRSATGAVIAGQTWDLNPADVAFVVAIHRRPLDGPAAWTVTCAGCPPLIGLNAEGVAVGTTNVKTRGARPGVLYLDVLRRCHEARRLQDAVASTRAAPRAGAHTFWFASPTDGLELETSPDRVVERRPSVGPLLRTNHCLDGEHAARELEAVGSSSRCRLARLDALLGEGLVDVPRLRRAFADRGDGVDSINRYPDDGQAVTTNAVVIVEPSEGRLLACRGPADRGRWVTLTP